jgi:hypothetical protein
MCQLDAAMCVEGDHSNDRLSLFSPSSNFGVLNRINRHQLLRSQLILSNLTEKQKVKPFARQICETFCTETL